MGRPFPAFVRASGQAFLLAFLAGGIWLKSAPGNVLPECKLQESPAKPVSEAEAYGSTPFKPGETSTFDVYYLGIRVGYAWIRTHLPAKIDGVSQRVFSAEGKTGDWYRYAFVAHDIVHAFSRAQDFAIRKFYMKQDEGTLFGKKLRQEKWSDFRHDRCVVSEKVKKGSDEAKTQEFSVEAGASDVLSSVFNLRTRDFKLGKVERILVYTSEKNWWLEAIPVAFDKVSVEAGDFPAMKIKLQTFIGEELQQKGDVHIWIAHQHPNRPLVKVEGEIKLGSVRMLLSKFEAGSESWTPPSSRK